MKATALGMVVRNEEYFLEKTVPLYRHIFEGLVAVDNGSTDHTKDILHYLGFSVVDGNFDDLVLTGRNRLILEAERMGFEAMVVMDADEALFPDAVFEVKEQLQNEEFIALPRIEMVKDFKHFDPSFFPDLQGRGFQLHKGYHWVGNIHEFLFKENNSYAALANPDKLVLPQCPIYHYGKCDKPEDLYIKYTNYDLRNKGLQPIKAVPEGVVINAESYYGHYRPFFGVHPLGGLEYEARRRNNGGIS